MNFYEQIFSRGRATGEGMTHFERLFAAKFGGSPPPEVREYTGAVPVTITADGTPLIDLLISGNKEHSGTPTSDNPVMPQGTGNKTANLFDKSKRTDNSRVVYTTGEIGALFSVFVSDFTPIEPNTTYTLNIVSSISGKTGHLFALYDENKNFVNTGAHEASSATVVYTFTTPSNVAYIRFNGNMSSVDEIMLNTGSTALPYEPFGVKIPISSANTTTPVYLGEVQTTRRIKKVVFTGSADETWNRAGSSHGYFTDLPNEARTSGVTDIISSHYVPAMSSADGTVRIGNSKTEVLIYDNFTSVTNFKAYLAQQYANGTPVTIWYVLATPTTGIVNEPLMKIGDYADTLSKAQAGANIPTNNGSTTVDVDTTVKPSEVYIKYMG